jgi:hypothetical protein
MDELWRLYLINWFAMMNHNPVFKWLWSYKPL